MIHLLYGSKIQGGVGHIIIFYDYFIQILYKKQVGGGSLYYVEYTQKIIDA